MTSQSSLTIIFEFCGGRLAAAQFLCELHYSLLSKWIYNQPDREALAVPRKFFGSREIKRELKLLAVERDESVLDEFANAVFTQIDCSRESLASPPTERWPYFSPYGLAQATLGTVIDEAELRYVVARGIRHRHGIAFSSEVAADFYFHAKSLNQFLSERRVDTPISQLTIASALSCHEYLAMRYKEVRGSSVSGEESPCTIRAFLDAGLLAGSTIPHQQSIGKLRFPGAEIDAEFHLAHLFDMPTKIHGLNDILGGVGPRLTDRSLLAPTDGKPSFPGRFIIIVGQPGTGKSLLAMSMAIEVAKKEGIAWYYPLEQSFEQTRYCLNTVASLPRDGSVQVTQTAKEAGEFLRSASANKGLVALMHARDEGITELLHLLHEHTALAAPLLSKRLQLLIVDPINAITFDPETIASMQLARLATTASESTTENLTSTGAKKASASGSPNSNANSPSRSAIFERFARMTQTGVNILVVMEEELTSAPPQLYAENLADTVIRLSIDDQDNNTAHGYARRRIEVVKSRYQREQRGRHAFTIRPATGIHIFPGITSYRLRNLARTIRVGDHFGGTGLASLDRLLAERPIVAGLTTVLRGPIGAFRTHLALAFLKQPSSQSDPDVDLDSTDNRSIGRRWTVQLRKVCNLFITMRYSRHQVNNLLTDGLVASAGSAAVETITVTSGTATTGQIMTEIDEAIHDVRSRGFVVERVVLDEFGDWSDLNPFVQDDAGFAPTLIDFLRRRSLAILSTLTISVDEKPSLLYRSALETADTLIDLDRVSYAGRSRVLLRVVHTPKMKHQPESYELEVSPTGRLRVQETPSLLRTVGEEVLSVAEIRLYLTCETDQQETYNQRLERALQNVLAPTARVQRLDDMLTFRTEHLDRLGVVDAVQIWQRDEFEVATANHRGLHRFKICDIAKRFPGFLDLPERFLSRCCNRAEQYCFAIPYYDNLSFLAFRSDILDDYQNRDATGKSNVSWDKLAEWAAEFEPSDSENNGVECQLFFDFPKGTDENYNALFLEIVASLSRVTHLILDGETQLSLEEWLQGSNEGVTRRAADIFWRLCSRAHRSRYAIHDSKRSSSPDGINQMKRNQLRTNPTAVVSRQWFTTYVQFIADLEATASYDVLRHLSTCRLPGEITTAGEWYLMVPAHSATPSVSLDILESVCSRHSELERFRSGAGLPVRSSLSEEYRNIHSVAPNVLLPDTSSIIRRSCFQYYTYLSPILGGCLRRLLDHNALTENDLTEWLSRMALALRQGIDAMRSEGDRFRKTNPAME